MATPAQAAAATAGTGGAALAAGYGITYAVGGDSQEESSEEELTEEQRSILSEPKDGIVTYTAEEVLTEGYTTAFISKIASHNRTFLVKANQEKNKKWWKWAYENKYLKNTVVLKDQIFENVVSFPETGNTLEKACDNAYKATNTKFETPSDHLLNNLSLFCTVGIQVLDLKEPFSKTYKDENSLSDYNNGILKEATNKPKLVQSKPTENQKWWEWAFNNKFDKTQKENLSTVFQKVDKGYNSTAQTNPNSETALNHACDNAYKKATNELTTSENKLLKEIEKFCTPTKNSIHLEIPK